MKQHFAKYWLGKKFSEAHKKKLSIASSGDNCSVETRKKMSAAHKDRSGFMLGKRHSEETKRKMSLAQKGSNNAFYGKKHSEETIKKIVVARKNQVFSEETKRKISIANSGKNHPNWLGGITDDPYCDAWLDEGYKGSIKKRDNYTCQNSDCWGNCNHLPLQIHHIDYNKMDCRPQNLITLCASCNPRANVNREYWTKFYQEIMIEKYGYDYK